MKNERASDRDRRLDAGVGDVIFQPEILEAEGEKVLHFRVDPHRRQRLGRARKLLARLLEMVGVEMRVAQRMDEIAGLQPGHLRHHHRQQRIGRDVRGKRKEFVQSLRGGVGSSVPLDEAALEARVLRGGVPLVACFHWILQLQRHVLLGNAERALEFAAKANQYSGRRVSIFSRWITSLPPCLVGLEACGSAHHWARELIKLGHDARMMPPAYVKPYIRRQKNDAADAAAICEAVTRPSMRFVGVRSLENQAALMRHKAREMLVSQRTQLLNGLRGHLTEVGVIAAQGPRHARELAELIEACDETIPFEVCEALAPLVVQLRNLDEAIARLDRTIAKLAQKDETARRLMSIPGFGPITASAMAATIQDTSSFAGPREFAAFLGLTPKQNSSGGKPKLGRISKMGNRNLRKLLVVGAHAVLFHRKPHTDPLRMWAKKLIEKKPFKLVAVALANKMARIAFAILREQDGLSGNSGVRSVGRVRGRGSPRAGRQRNRG